MFNLTGFLGRRKTAVPAASDSLDAFLAEDVSFATRPVVKGSASAWPYLAALTVVALIGTAAGGLYLLKKAEPVSAAPSAAVTIESDPVGAQVSSGGAARGVTPLTLSVAPGEHLFDIVHAGRHKQVRVVARAETAVVHHVQFDMTPAPSPAKPPKAVRRPAAPAAAVATSGVSVPAGPAAGWIAIAAPIPLIVSERGQVIGSTEAPKIMLPAGKRELRFGNDSLGFAEIRTIQVGAGKTARISIAVPKAPISINAVPWAEVWVDGVRVGETPIGNYMVSIGSHDVVFRHPTLGERRQAATVSLTAPARVSVDMRKQ